ncbi:ATP synthase F1 subunit delta [Mediterraneibacter sp. NSJ-55]|uniref:ATP synthase subunit delta n=1 Tax=Mediterraneibacter hominis TaxID=2763054 RepID=A0A923RQK7_9FIRM|nr:ATP synthase F1 subunit delta [Mediterraneibacter hominis]MBC5689684.1 ATP synthase F1 subunit delta [Mediterraneibacter hominis]
MTQTKNSAGQIPAAAIRYARVLYELTISKEAIQEARDILKEVPVLYDVFINPVIAGSSKMRVIDRIFPEEIRNFLKLVCKNNRMNLITDIFAAYDKYLEERERIVHAQIICVEPPDKEHQKRIEVFLLKKYSAVKVKLTIRKDPRLLGGFILLVGNDEYDWSLKGRLERLEQKLTWR